ncbi:MAG: hypothetical protein WAV04_00380 [Candidatus Microsaccharimonas sp.]
MVNYRTSRILPIILVIVIIIIAVAALVSLARVVFFSGTSTAPAAVADVSKEALLNTSASHSVSMTVRGPIVADEEFHSYKIDISASSRQLSTFTGYLDTVVDRTTLGNSVAAYEEFVYALDKANLVKGTELAGDKNDIRGICATGRVYQFSVLENGNSVKTLWTSTCQGSSGSLKASATQLTELFTNQIPGSDKLIKKVSL